ncbi:MAG: hypothetical protein V4577_25700 [Bacteroidota bacterium]
MKEENKDLKSVYKSLSRAEMKKITGGDKVLCGDGYVHCFCCDGHGNCKDYGCTTVAACCA